MAGPGDTVTLFCSSKIPFDKYHLSKKQEARGHWLSGGQSHNGIFQVDLPLCLVSPTSVGSYRCYGAFNESPYEWSAPSDTLQVPVTGEDPMPAACSGTSCTLELYLRGVLLEIRRFEGFWTK